MYIEIYKYNVYIRVYIKLNRLKQERQKQIFKKKKKKNSKTNK